MMRLYPPTVLKERHMAELEKEYEKKHADPENAARLDELRFLISGLLGKNNLHYLREYTDRLIAQFNTDCAWFYRKGVEEGRRMAWRP